MGQYKIHSTKISLVLDINSGYTSPQFHSKIDDQFQTRELINNVKINWMHRCGLKTTEKLNTEHNDELQNKRMNNSTAKFGMEIHKNQATNRNTCV